MVSICVPTYQYDISQLIGELHAQMEALPVQTELRVYDDASPRVPTWWEGREELGGMHTTFQRLSENIGRGAIRNKLVREARYDHVILMDADGEPGPDFLANYLASLQQHSGSENLLIIGGRTYTPTPPDDPALRLHWSYGIQRESTGRPYADNAFHGFQSNNFLASRRLLLDHPFPEEAIGYGHEDTLWGQQLSRQGVKLVRIGNPVIHLGLEPNEVFIGKQQEAVANLVRLKQQFPELRTRLTDLGDHITWASVFLNLLSEKFLIGHLCKAQNPELKLLDLLKLKWYVQQKRQPA